MNDRDPSRPRGPRLLLLVALAFLVHVDTRTEAQSVRFRLQPAENNPDVPGPGEEIAVDVAIVTSEFPGDGGLVGWELSLGNTSESIHLVDATWDGTAAAIVSEGGFAHDVESFRTVQLVDPERGGQGEGLISAVVLRWFGNVILPPNREHVVLRASYLVDQFTAGSTDVIRFRDGLRVGVGPILNTATNDSNVVIFPGLDPELRVETSEAVPESATSLGCLDGQDNDRDGLVDCEDPDCEAICPPAAARYTIVADGPEIVADDNFDMTVSISGPGGGFPEAAGVEAWSFGLEHPGCVWVVGEPGLEGTRASALLDGGYERTEIIDPARNGGRHGIVSAVVLSFETPVSLDPSRTESVLAFRCRFREPDGEPVDASFRFVEDLRGAGLLVDTALSVHGASVEPMRRGLTVRREAARPVFRRGDANDDGGIDLSDGVFTLNALFTGGPPPVCADAADTNDDGSVNLSDAVHVMRFLFLAGLAPPAPGPSVCGEDPTPDRLPRCEDASCP